MKIFIDDGSTNIKLAWLEDGDVKTLISPNSFKPEWSFSLLDDAAPANYEIDGEKFSFDPLSADAVVTTETRYQYSDGFAPIFPDTCYHLTHYWPAAADIPVASDNPVHYADAIRYNARTPLQGSLLPLTRLV